MDPAITYFLMKLYKWIDGKVEIMHVLSFCNSDQNFVCCGKLNKWIDGKVEIKYVLSFCYSDQNFGCYGNLKFPLASNGKKWILQ